MFPTELSALYNKLTVGMCLICQEIKQDQQQNLFFIHPGDLPGWPHQDHFLIYFGIKCSKSDTWTNSCVVRNKLLLYCTPAFVVRNLNDETSQLMLGVLQLIISEISYKIVWSCEMRVKSGTRWQHLIFNCTSCRLNLQMSCNDVTGQTPACPFTAQTLFLQRLRRTLTSMEEIWKLVFNTTFKFQSNNSKLGLAWHSVTQEMLF